MRPRLQICWWVIGLSTLFVTWKLKFFAFDQLHSIIFSILHPKKFCVSKFFTFDSIKSKSGQPLATLWEINFGSSWEPFMVPLIAFNMKFSRTKNDFKNLTKIIVNSWQSTNRHCSHTVQLISKLFSFFSTFLCFKEISQLPSIFRKSFLSPVHYVEVESYAYQLLSDLTVQDFSLNNLNAWKSHFFHINFHWRKKCRNVKCSVVHFVVTEIIVIGQRGFNTSFMQTQASNYSFFYDCHHSIKSTAFN